MIVAIWQRVTGIDTSESSAPAAPAPWPTPAGWRCGPGPALGLGLGLDAGGTQTRWAVADSAGHLLAEGAVAGLSALQLASAAGRAHVAAALQGIAQAARSAAGEARVAAVVAGLTGFDGAQTEPFTALAAPALGVAPAAVRVCNDIELACRAAFAPGQGVVVYGGTGSVAAHLDGHGVLHRVGGHGGVIDDAGGGHWIACQALRHVWRAEDAAPGCWRASALALALFEQIGGSDWATTRHWVYGPDATRGRLGTLALAVAAAADADPAARHILQAAGTELARLAAVLLRRVAMRPPAPSGALSGAPPDPLLAPLPCALAGRVFDLHPAIEHSLRAALPAGTAVQRARAPAHHAAARLAAGLAAGMSVDMGAGGSSTLVP